MDVYCAAGHRLLCVREQSPWMCIVQQDIDCCALGNSLRGCVLCSRTSVVVR